MDDVAWMEKTIAAREGCPYRPPSTLLPHTDIITIYGHYYGRVAPNADPSGMPGNGEKRERSPALLRVSCVVGCVCTHLALYSAPVEDPEAQSRVPVLLEINIEKLEGERAQMERG